MNKEIMKIVDRILSEEVSDKMSNIRKRILENKNMCSECSIGEMIEGQCNECGYMNEAQLDELGGMEDGHPRFGKKRFSREMSIEDIERLLSGYDDEEEDMDVDTYNDMDPDIEESECVECGPMYESKKLSKGQKYIAKQEKPYDEIDARDFKKLRAKKSETKEGAKPDFLDLDNDGDKKEPMKSAAKEVKEKWSGDADVEKTGEHANKTIAEINKEIKSLKKKTEEYQKDGKKVPHKLRSLLSQLYFAKRAKKDDWSGKVAVTEEFYELHLDESTGENIMFTENEIIDLIENIVIEEQKKKNKNTVDPELKKSLKISEKENEDAIKNVVEKMKQYLKNGSKGKYEMNPKHFPKGNGELEVMEKMAFQLTDDNEDFNYEIAGLNIPVPDAIDFNDERMNKYYEGSSETGNDVGGNALESDANSRFNKLRKKQTLDKLKKQSYKRAPQPVFNEKSGQEKGEGIKIKLESTEDKKVISEITKMKDLIGYNRKTQ
jgi:hypothetical protein